MPDGHHGRRRVAGRDRGSGPAGRAGDDLGGGARVHELGRLGPFLRLASWLAPFGEVRALDFRGHGRSAGGSGVGGDPEMHDVDAAVRAARADGAHAVVTVGLSMGGGAVLRQAALGRHRPDAAVSVSAVSRWYVRDTRPVQRVHWLLETTGGSAPGWCNCGSTSRG